MLSETLGELDSESCAVGDLELLPLLDGNRDAVFVSDVLVAPENEDARDGLTLGLSEPDAVTLALTLTDEVPESVAHAEEVAETEAEPPPDFEGDGVVERDLAELCDSDGERDTLADRESVPEPVCDADGILEPDPQMEGVRDLTALGELAGEEERAADGDVVARVDALGGAGDTLAPSLALLEPLMLGSNDPLAHPE